MVTFEMDNETKFSIFAQEEQHLSDEDLFKYLNDLKCKDKYLNKLVPLLGQIEVNLTDLPANVLETSHSSLDKSSNQRFLVLTLDSSIIT
jgi:hypothetical protein